MAHSNSYLRPISSAAAAAALILFSAGSPASAQVIDAVESDITSKADAMLQGAFPADGPGAAAIVTRGGRVIYAGGRGPADVEAARPITPETPFRLGSIVKQFTAASILKLVDDGKLSLDDPISRFFPDWPAPGAGATVRQLLNHSSGLQDFSKVPGWIVANRHRAWTTKDLLAVSRALPARTEPGKAWEYNNGGYVMLGAIIEKVTGKSWHEVVEERLTRPLGLDTIGYAIPADVDPSGAKGYTEKDRRQQPIQLSHMSIAHAAGGLEGSVSDMAKWAYGLHHGKVVSPALYREMTTPARLADGSTEPYGFGLRLRELRGRKAFVHGGAGGGLDTDSVYVPSEDLFVAVFANSDDPASDPSILTRRLAALALGEPFPVFTRVPVDMASVEPLLGVYSAERGPARRFFERDGRLFMGRGDDEREVFAARDDRFFFGQDDLAWFRLMRQPSGAHVMQIHAPEAAAPFRLVRTGAVPAAFAVPRTVLQGYVGTFQTETIAVVIAMDAKGDLTITPYGQSPLAMRPVSPTEFRIDGGMMRLVFAPAADGRSDVFTLYRGARELHGKRVFR